MSRKILTAVAISVFVGCSTSTGSSIAPDGPAVNFVTDAGPDDVADVGNGPWDSGPVTFDAGPAGPDSGFETPDAGSETDAGPTLTMTTVSAIVMAGRTGPKYVEVDTSIVVAVHDYSTGASQFYIQDEGVTGPGLAVLHAKTDTAPIPAVGDIVSVTGVVGVRDGVLGIGSGTELGVALAVSVIRTGGTATGGAYAPAGTPITETSTGDYAYTNHDALPRQVGNVLQFSGPLSVTSPKAFFLTGADGGTDYVGFEVTGGLWVFDEYLRQSGCLHNVDGGVGSLDLSNGITGVWDRFQDPNGTGDGGNAIYPVLYPVQCSDVNLQ
jgi:hypothetical protein